MEEVDSIIIHFLKQLNISIEENIMSMSELSVETVVEAVSKCLSTINPSIKVPPRLPPGISHRIEVASHLASLCKDLGYKSDVGYQTFLYSNETDLRQVFMFLIERLPNESKESSKTSVSFTRKSLLMQGISKRISDELSKIWIPPCCDSQLTSSFGDYKPIEKNLSQTNLSEKELVQKVSRIKEHNQSLTNICLKEKHTKKETEHDSKPNYDLTTPLKELKETAILLRQKLGTFESDKNLMNVEFAQAAKSCHKLQEDLSNIQNILLSIGITSLEEDQLTGNMLEIANSKISTLHRRSEELSSVNLSLRIELDRLKNLLYASDSEKNKCKKILSNLKNHAKSLKEEYENKEELKNQLKKNYEKLRGGNKRSVYTKRILEIISNVDKQNMEIKKILDDTRNLQKEINSLEGQLDRCFSIADETLFKDAKKDDQAKKAYKLLALLHSECNSIVSLVNETGTLARDIVDLEDSIKSEKAKHIEETLQKIQNDIKQIQEE